MNNSRNFAYRKPGLFLAKGTIIPIAVVSILSSNPGLAQITPDTTLGNQNSRVTTGVNIKGNEADLIEGGVQRGSNLYHSFAEFNVNNGQKVYFANPTGVDNILSRVTGSNPSNILGTLGVNGAANLFLLNPQGIIFGPNARLDIQGSFLATTDDSFKFPDGSEFSATNPQAPPLLTMSVPVGVQFGSQPAASITSEGELVAGKDLTLDAGNLDLQGTLQAGGNLTLQAQDSLKVRDSTSIPFIAAAGGNLLVQGNHKVNIYTFNHPNSGFFSGGNMVFKSENTISGSANFWGGGNFRIENLNGDLGYLFNFYDEQDDLQINSFYPLVIRAIGDVSFDGYKGVSLHILAGGSVNISDGVKIIGAGDSGNFLQQAVTLSDGKKIDIDGSQKPTLDIRAGVDANFIEIPNFMPNLLIGFNGQNTNKSNESTNANISIKKDIYNTSDYIDQNGQILITNNYKPNKLAGNITIGETLSAGNVTVDSRGDIITNGEINTGIITNEFDYVAEYLTTGSIKLLANQDILISEQSALLSDTKGFFNIKSGDIYLNSQHGKININSDVISKAGNGISGNITVQAAGDIHLFKKIEGTSRNNQEQNYQDNSNITINSIGGSVYLNGSALNSSNQGSGNAGDIRINASEQISILNGSKIFSQGNYGKIFIGDNNSDKYTPRNIVDTYTPKKIFIDNKSEINTNSSGSDLAGDITIQASEEVSLLNGSKISSEGNYGIIDISTGSLFLNQNSEINTNNKSGDAGYIEITTQNLLLRRGSKISTTGGAGGTQGNGGNITINAKDGFVAAVPSENSDITANAFGGKGGTIQITANRILGFQNRGKLSSEQLNNLTNNRISDISASSDVGENGEVSLNTLSIDPSQGLVALPTNLVDTSRLIAQGCGSNSNVAKGKSEFVITGRGGLLPSPDDTLKPGAISPEWVVNNTVSNSNNSESMPEMNFRELSSNTADTLVEAVGMVRSANGDIVFTAQPTTATGLQSGLSSQVCSVVQGNVRQ